MKDIKQIMDKVNKEEQIQSKIHDDINFWKNTINLLIGKRGSGKSFNVNYEMVKLGYILNHGRYTCFIIISDKDNDSTINEMLKLIKLKVIQINYDKALKTLGDTINGKTAYDQVLTNHLQERLTDNSKENILNLTADKRFKVNLPHTGILMDDAINAFKRKEDAALEDMLFRNRYPRFTIFICTQDPYSIPVKIRRNLDSLWLFGGFTHSSMFQRLLNSFSPGEEDKEEAWEQYRELNAHDAMQFNL
jgi:hypothetical protein